MYWTVFLIFVSDSWYQCIEMQQVFVYKYCIMQLFWIHVSILKVFWWSLQGILYIKSCYLQIGEVSPGPLAGYRCLRKEEKACCWQQCLKLRVTNVWMRSIVDNSDSRVRGETLQVRVGWSLLSWTKGGWSGSVGGNPLAVRWLGLHTFTAEDRAASPGRAWDLGFQFACCPIASVPFPTFLSFLSIFFFKVYF